MEKKLILFSFIFCVQFCLHASYQDVYSQNIERALQAHEVFDGESGLKNLEKVRELFLQIYEKEKMYPEYIQCITAQDSIFYAYQVIAKELFRKFYGEPKEEFEFLRFPTQKLLKNSAEFFSKCPSFIFERNELARMFNTTSECLEETLCAHEMREEEEFGKIAAGYSEDEKEMDDEGCSTFPLLNDTDSAISRELLSVNFTLETYRPLDSALFVFLSGRSVTSFLQEEELTKKVLGILRELFIGLPVDREKLDRSLTELIQKAPRTYQGIINQIFIPKEYQENFLYLSFGGGFLHPFHTHFGESFEDFQKNRQSESFRTFRNFQARLVVGSIFEDPRVKIVRYTLIPEEEQKAYELLVRNVIERL